MAVRVTRDVRSSSSSALSLRARAREVVSARPTLAFVLAAGALMHASGHALLAAAGGSLARTLGGGAGPMDARSIPLLRALGAGDALLGLAVLGTCAAAGKAVGGALAAWAEARVAGEVGARLRLDVLDRLLAVHRLRGPRHRDHGDDAARAARHTGARLAALTTHVLDVERGVAQGVVGEARALVQLVPLAALLVALAPRLAGSAALALSAFGVLALGARRALKRAHRRAARDAERLLSAGDEAVRHAELWVTYGATRTIRRHVARLGEALVGTHARLRAHAALVSGASEVLGALALVLALALAAGGALGGVDHATLLPFAVAFFMAYKPLRELIDARIARARGSVGLDAALGEDARAEPSDEQDDDASRPHAGRWPLAELVVDGLATLNGKHAPLALRVPAGAIVAIVGPTGVGKTSLLRALLGLEAPRAGTVTYAGVPLDDQGAGPRARPFAWVPQDAPVLAATLAENVALAQASADDARGALDRIGAGPLARSLGAAELVTARPVSGGERQWIALARAVASGAPVLLLDEPTSAMDPEAQARVLGALAGLRGERTVVLVTHRPEPLAIADVVVRLEAAGPAADGDGRAVAALGDVSDDRGRARGASVPP